MVIGAHFLVVRHVAIKKQFPELALKWHEMLKLCEIGGLSIR